MALASIDEIHNLVHYGVPFVSKCLLSDFSFLRAAIVLYSDVSFLERRIESDDSVLHRRIGTTTTFQSDDSISPRPIFLERRFYFIATNLFRATILFHSDESFQSDDSISQRRIFSERRFYFTAMNLFRATNA